MVIIVDVDRVVIPTPIAATVEIVRRDHPAGAIIKHHMTCAIVDGPNHEIFLDVLIVTVRIVAPRRYAVVFVVPISVIIASVLKVTFMTAVIVTVVVIPIAMLVPAVVFAVVVMIVAVAMIVPILGRCRER